MGLKYILEENPTVPVDRLELIGAGFGERTGHGTVSYLLSQSWWPTWWCDPNFHSWVFWCLLSLGLLHLSIHNYYGAREYQEVVEVTRRSPGCKHNLLSPNGESCPASAWWSKSFVHTNMVTLPVTCWYLYIRNTKETGGSHNLPLLMCPGKNVD